MSHSTFPPWNKMPTACRLGVATSSTPKPTKMGGASWDIVPMTLRLRDCIPSIINKPVVKGVNIQTPLFINQPMGKGHLCLYVYIDMYVYIYTYIYMCVCVIHIVPILQRELHPRCSYKRKGLEIPVGTKDLGSRQFLTILSQDNCDSDPMKINHLLIKKWMLHIGSTSGRDFWVLQIRILLGISRSSRSKTRRGRRTAPCQADFELSCRSWASNSSGLSRAQQIRHWPAYELDTSMDCRSRQSVKKKSITNEQLQDSEVGCQN